MERKNCKTVIDIEEAAEDIYSKTHGEKIIQSVRELSERFKDYKATIEEIKDKMPNKRKVALDNVKHARKVIDDYLNELEANAVADVDRLFKEEIKAIEEQIHVCVACLSSLNTSISNIDRTMSVGNQEEKFIGINRATKQTKRYCNKLLDLRRETSELDVKFEPNITLAEVFDSLGIISTETSKVPNVFTDTKPIYTGEIKIKPVDDDNDDDGNDDDDDNDDDDGGDDDDDDDGDNRPVVTSFDVLPDGRKLVFDLNNDRIQLYDKNNIFITESVLPVGEKCVSFVLCSSTEALVSTDDDRFFKVTIGELAISEIKIEFSIGLLAKYDDAVVGLLGLKDNEELHLCIIDKDLKKIKKTILKDDGSRFELPGFIGVSADKNIIYVLDCDRDCYGIALVGQVLFHYQNPEAEVYCGLAVDSDGLFIACTSEDDFQVEKLNFNGEREEVYTVFGNSFPLKVIEDELILYTSDGSSGILINCYCLLK